MDQPRLRHRAEELGIDPPSRPNRLVLPLFLGVMVAFVIATYARGGVRAAAAGALVGALALVAELALAVVVVRRAKTEPRSVVVGVSAAVAAAAAALAGRWWGAAGAIPAAVVTSTLTIWLLVARLVAVRQLRAASAFAARLATGASPAEVDAHVAHAARWHDAVVYASVTALHRHGRLGPALELLRGSRTQGWRRAGWLITLELERGEVARAREALDLIRDRGRGWGEMLVVLDARIRIAEGDAGGVVADLAVDPRDVAVASRGPRWAARADALVTTGDHVGARALLERLAASDPRAMARLAAGHRPCAALAREVVARAGAPFR